MKTRMTELLEFAADEAPTARLPEDLWRRGRRLRLRQRLASAGAVAVVVLAVIAGMPALLLRTSDRDAAQVAGGTTDAVPARLHMPHVWQAPVTEAPAGPASILFSGYGALRGIDGPDDEGKVAVVGRNGSYRMLTYGGAETVAGEEVLISPNGRYVAEGHLTAKDYVAVPNVVDLQTGKIRTYPPPAGRDGRVVAWSPDGSRLLVLWYDNPAPNRDGTVPPPQPAQLVLLDLASGATTALAEVDVWSVGGTAQHPYYNWALRTASLAAFSPDGSRIAVSVGPQLRLFDTGGRPLWTVDLGPRRHLVGIGAFTPDGTRITTTTVDGCIDVCDSAQLGARRWSFGYLDPATGADTAGPALAPVTGLAVRGLGWRYGTDLVALTYRPAPETHKQADAAFNDTGYWEVGSTTLVALRGAGGTEVLLDPPDNVVGLDVPRDLLEAGRFGGASPEPSALPVRRLFVWYAVVAAVLLLIPVLAGGVLVVAVRRRHRRRTRRPAAR